MEVANNPEEMKQIKPNSDIMDYAEKTNLSSRGSKSTKRHFKRIRRPEPNIDNEF